MRTLYIGGARLETGNKIRDLEYTVIVNDLLNEERQIVGESYGIRIRMAEPVSGIEPLEWPETETVCDITAKYDKILAFALKLNRLKVTPMSLRDIIYDCLPL